MLPWVEGVLRLNFFSCRRCCWIDSSVFGLRVVALRFWVRQSDSVGHHFLWPLRPQGWRDFTVYHYKYDPSLAFTPSQRWQPTARYDSFPYCRLQRAQIDMVRAQWQNLGHPDHIMPKFLNLHCVETNVIEGLVQFNESVSLSFNLHSVPEYLLSSQASTKLVQLGFYNQVEPVNEMNPIGGAVRDRADALSLLRDTHEVSNPCYLCLMECCWRISSTYRHCMWYLLSYSLTPRIWI